jgi:hypothetical protein
MIKKEYKSILRKFHYIFTKKQKEQIIIEAIYYKKIYSALSIDDIMEVVTNKYIKMKLYNIVFPDISKKLKEDFIQ